MSSLFRSRNNFFTKKRENELKEVLINTLKENTREVQYESEEYQKDTLDLCEATSSLCISLESIFLHGLKDSFLWQTLSVISGDEERRPDPSFWPPLMVFLHKQVLEQLQTLSQINTEIGQCRAWIRLSLNECILSAHLKNMRNNASALSPYYKNYALLKDGERLDIIISLMEGLESSLAFNLPYNTSLLNQWSDLALQLSGLWSPAIKPIQISSGIDIAGTISTTTAIPAPMPVQTNEFFPESISNSPFTRSSGPGVFSNDRTAANTQTDNVDKVLHKPNNDIDVINEEVTDNDDKQNFSPDYTHGNSLSNLMQTSWSSEYKSPQRTSFRSLSNENVTTPSLIRSQSMTSSTSSLRGMSQRLSYNTLLRNHVINRPVDWTEVWEKFLLQNPTPNMPIGSNSEEHPENTLNDTEDSAKFELLSAGMDDFDIVELQEMVEQLCHLAHEPGLNAQGFVCRTCQHPLGIGYINFQVCAFSGYYFCHNCMASEAVLIPARIIYNWDFRKYRVSKRAAAFLTEFADQPFIDLKSLNPDIYKAIDAMAELQAFRIRLNFIRVYLITCSPESMEKLQRQFFGREYLYEHIHQYSIADLAMIQRGSLYQMLQKSYKIGESHILKCVLCSLKGFICEICKSQHVLYPFHIDTTFRCQICGAVFHPACLNEYQPCPKCTRKRKREEEQKLMLEVNEEPEEDESPKNE